MARKAPRAEGSRVERRQIDPNTAPDAVRETANRPGERLEDYPKRGRVRFQVSEEVVAREERGAGVLECGRARRTRAPIEQRELAEELARPHDRDEGLLSELAGEGDLHTTLEHHVQVRSGVVLPEDHLAALEAFGPHAVRELGKLAVGEPGEERKPPEVLGNALLGHPPDSTCGT